MTESTDFLRVADQDGVRTLTIDRPAALTPGTASDASRAGRTAPVADQIPVSKGRGASSPVTIQSFLVASTSRSSRAD